MARLTRRRFMQAAGAGGDEGRRHRRASWQPSARPPVPEATTVHRLRRNDFAPASERLRKELLPEAEKALGIKVNLETINGNDLQPRVTAAVQSGSGATRAESELNKVYA